MKISNFLQLGSGPGLAFMTFSDALLLMDVSPLWSILFFMMLILLGIDSEFGTLEAAISPLYELGWVKMSKPLFTGMYSVPCFCNIFLKLLIAKRNRTKQK